MGCLSVTYERIQANLSVIFAPICGTDIGEPFLLDANGRLLADSEDRMLIAKK